ncbi:MAG: hypothetical protein NT149_01270 [Candidatus Gottesmanbacteria bacterium]|nr:hypothetical protein [Candidatus Gottesmanbacteria bacterium]
MARVVPLSLQGVLWSKATSKLDCQRDKNYIIHQILSYGTWEHIRWLFDTYGRDEIKNIFLHYPAKNYTEKTFHFFGNVVLGIMPGSIDIKDYVKTLPRVIE